MIVIAVGADLSRPRNPENQNVIQLTNPGGIAVDSPTPGRGTPAWVSISGVTPRLETYYVNTIYSQYISEVFIDIILTIVYITRNEVINMGDKVLSKQDLQKRVKIDDEKFQFFIEQEILEEKESYTEEDLDRVREFRKLNPLDLNDIVKKFKLNREQINSFRTFGLIGGSFYFSNKDLDIFQSWQKLKRLGYSDGACFKVLSEVGVPREENLFENDTLIQLKELSETTGIPERTIKFYEKENLILKPRIYKNKRFYEAKILDDLILIRDMQHIGYKLSSIAEFLNSVRDDKEKLKVIDTMKQEINEKIKIAKAIIKRVEAI